ncbi:MAG: bifunctional phosphopantothenoylcysteine decarboxylase/phosphopantothenate--cysteine ligase CoaBC [Desulfovibrio sp.]|nr:bifunctional phosphopantothenoylcysteine decarboxylase/phosphopantothenate--cysteine ligase CoaBC [Desulfovibrio sp.]
MTDLISALRLLTRLKSKSVHLGVTGSVACYKAIELMRALLHAGMRVSATLTPAAREFVTPLLFESLGAFPVYSDLFRDGDVFAHLEPGQNADAFFVVPASANTLAKMAQGLAMDMLSAQYVAFDGPVLAAPSMNVRMWNHPATQSSVKTLRDRGVAIIEPDAGSLACGSSGKGRLASLQHLFLHALRAVAPGDMQGQRVMVTLGPTREPWDGVRFWSNPSSGLMGSCLALASWIRGAEVTAVAGPGVPEELLPSDLPGLVRINAFTAQDMFEKASSVWPESTLGMFCAAVADFSPVPFGDKKFKKADHQDGFSVQFTANRDILATLAGERQGSQKTLGFAAETAGSMDELLALAKLKRERKGADIIAANCVNQPGSGFAAPTNSMAVACADGRGEIWPTLSKADVAWDLCTWLLQA